MNDIPEDIMIKARKAAAAIRKGDQHDQSL